MNMFSTQHFRLTFNEANILTVNIMNLSHPNFIIKLQELIKSTTDETLREATVSLLQKVANLTSEEYLLLQQDIKQGKVSYPPNYMLK